MRQPNDILRESTELSHKVEFFIITIFYDLKEY